MSRAAQEAVVEIDLAEPGLLTDLMTLTKARLSLLVIVTTFVGFCMASDSSPDWLRLFHTVFGTTLAAAAAGVLNQRIETEVDRLMERTRHRPLPAGRMKPATALVLGIMLGVAGPAWLWWTTNALSASLAAATIIIYIAFYTPLKRRTSLCTIVGAVSGASRRSSAGPRCAPRSTLARGCSSASFSPGRCRTSSPSRGCIATNTHRPVSS